MTQDQFVSELRLYLKQVLAGVCKDPNAIQFAVNIREKRIFAIAKVGAVDFAPIKYEGILDAAKTMAARFGNLRRNDQDEGRPFSAYLQLYDPSFEAPFTP